jgi:hypothetical protein
VTRSRLICAISFLAPALGRSPAVCERLAVRDGRNASAFRRALPRSVSPVWSTKPVWCGRAGEGLPTSVGRYRKRQSVR